MVEQIRGRTQDVLGVKLSTTREALADAFDDCWSLTAPAHTQELHGWRKMRRRIVSSSVSAAQSVDSNGSDIEDLWSGDLHQRNQIDGAKLELLTP